MFAKVTSLGLSGLAGYVVQVEADLSSGLPQFTLVGLPDSAVKESSERVRSAVKNLYWWACWPPRAFCPCPRRIRPFWGNWAWMARCAL